MGIGRSTLKASTLAAAFASALVLASCGASSEAEQVETASSDMEGLVDTAAMQFLSIDGEPMSLADFSGDVVLVVNTASKCGYTPQYEGLQALWEAHKDSGLTVVGVPSGDFAGQEFDDNAEVKNFCELNYGVTFPLTEKNHVVGDEAHPFFTYAKEVLGDDAVPKWNFHKVLLNREGVPIKAFATKVEPQDDQIVSAIQEALG